MSQKGLSTGVRNLIKNSLAFLVSFLILILAIMLRAINPPAVQEITFNVFDQFQRLSPRLYQDVPVRIIDLDEESLAKLGQWPWPRTLLAQMVERLSELGAAAIAFDIVFAEPDRTSPDQVLPLDRKS